MKKIYLLFVSALLVCCCANGTYFGRGVKVNGPCSENGIDFSEARTTQFFDSFKSFGPFNVYFVQSDTQKVLVEGREEFVKKLLTEVKDKTLSIEMEDGEYKDLVLKVTVFSPAIEDMSVAGSGDLICGDIVMPDGDLEFSTKGSGDVILGSVSCKELDLVIMGSGEIKAPRALSVREDAELLTMGSGDISIAEISCEDIEASTLGSGSVKIESAKVLKDADLSTKGSGDISICGQCCKADASTSGSGSIKGELKYESIEKKVSGSGSIKL